MCAGGTNIRGKFKVSNLLIIIQFNSNTSPYQSGKIFHLKDTKLPYHELDDLSKETSSEETQQEKTRATVETNRQ